MGFHPNGTKLKKKYINLDLDQIITKSAFLYKVNSILPAYPKNIKVTRIN